MTRLEEAIVKVCPEILTRDGDRYECNRVWSAWGMGTMTEDDFEAIEPTFTLADVLRAVSTIALPKHVVVLPSGNIYLFEAGVLGTPSANWNLTKDLDGQSPETIAFLESILCAA